MAKLKYKDKDGFWQELPVGTNVVANPTLTGTESELTGLKVGGTYYKIPVNKEYVDNGFVKKTTGHNKVYATDSTGTDSELGYSQFPANSAIIQYTSSGTVRANTPIDNLDCATKKYVDDNIAASGKLYQHTYTFETVTNDYVYCTTYKNSNTPMTAAEVINFFKSDLSVGKLVNVSVVNHGSTVGSGFFIDAGEGIDYTVVVLNTSADFTINADTYMTPNIIEI